MAFMDISLVPSIGATGLSVSVSTTSAQSAVISTTVDGYLTLWSDVAVFMRQGTNPTALTTDQYIPASQFLRIGPVAAGNKLAFITASGTGTVYLNKEF